MSNNSSFQLDSEQHRIAARLYRFALWADMLRVQFEAVLARDREELERRLRMKEFDFEPKLLESEMYNFLWLGVLYIVVEGWPALKVKEQPITELLRSPFKELLRNFRHATFHPEDFDDARIQGLVVKGQESIEWARELTVKFRSFFESRLTFP